MELNGTYIDPNVPDIIFKKLNYEDMISFLQVNRYMAKTYQEYIKYKVFDYINKDYKLYKNCFKRYTYDDKVIKELGIISLMNTNAVWGSYLTGYYDLRFIFELIMNGLDIYDEDIIRMNNKLNIRFILQKMNSCKSFNRFETILNINKEPSLTSLHYSFKPTEGYLSI